MSEADLAGVKKINLIAAGTSWHAALVGKFLLEEIARIPTEVDISSEFRYRKPIIQPGTLTVAITQSGETADTIAAIREAKQLGSLTLSITNVAGSMIVRETQGAIVYSCRTRNRSCINKSIHHTTNGILLVRPLHG